MLQPKGPLSRRYLSLILALVLAAVSFPEVFVPLFSEFPARRLPAPAEAARFPATDWNWSSLALCTTLSLAALVANPLSVAARDGTISPPTCVSIVNAALNCPPREAKDALKRAGVQVKRAEESLAAAEKEKAAKTSELPESEKASDNDIEVGSARGMLNFAQSELVRLENNQRFLEDLRSKLLARPLATSSGSSSSLETPRLISRLSIESSDIENEEKFWCEAIGMQRYGSLPGGGVVVAFGPTGLEGEEGAFFGIEILPASTAKEKSGTQKLSFVQLTTSSLIRISRVIASKGELVDGYGYYALKSPSGVQVWAYVDDRRDPVEFVALAVPRAKLQSESEALQKLGLKVRGAYVQPSPEMQAYMPDLPKDNILLGSGDPKQTVQVLLLPEEGDAKSSEPLDKIKEQLGRGLTMFYEPGGSMGVGMLEAEEESIVPKSEARGSQLTILGPAGSEGAAGRVAVKKAVAG